MIININIYFNVRARVYNARSEISQSRLRSRYIICKLRCNYAIVHRSSGISSGALRVTAFGVTAPHFSAILPAKFIEVTSCVSLYTHRFPLCCYRNRRFPCYMTHVTG